MLARCLNSLEESITFSEKGNTTLSSLVTIVDNGSNRASLNRFRSEKEIICGIVYDPIKDEMFYAEKNNGAYFNNKKIKVSKRKKLEDCLFVSGGLKNDKFKNFIEEKILIRKSGCAALDMAYVAAGRYDGYFQKNLSIWDIAAGIIILNEAGGKVNELDLDRKDNIDIDLNSFSIADQINNLVNECIKYGTTPFSILAIHP